MARSEHNLAVFSNDPWTDWRAWSTLARFLTVRHLEARYRGSALGFLWSMINPLAMMLIYTVVLSVFLKNEIEGVAHFSSYMLAGYLPWAFFSGCMMNTASSLLDNSQLVSKVYFPRVIVPFSVSLSNLINFIFSIPILIGLIFWLEGLHLLPLLQLPLAMAMLWVWILGLGMMVAILATRFRDTFQIIETILMAWFFATPVLYSYGQAAGGIMGRCGPDWGRLLLWIYRLNPMTAFFNWLHYCLLGLKPDSGVAGMPGLGFDIAWACVCAISACLAGWIVFSRKSQALAETL